jgi:hypothetical protein
MKRIVLAAVAAIAAYTLAPIEARAQGAPPPPPVTIMPHVSPIPWYLIGCPASIVLSALVADFKDNRQLTNWEAWTCGLLYWVPMPQQPKQRRSHHSALIVERPRYS